MKFRYFSLYFASVGPRQALLILYAGFTWVFTSRRRRIKLETLLKSEYCVGQVRCYTSARGAIAAFLRSINIGMEDSVLLSSFTCLAVPSAVIACGAKPIYVDINPRSLNVDFENIQKAIRSNTKVIVLQHTMGRPIDKLEEICRFCRERGVLIIEDCALSVGTKNNGMPVGVKGDVAIFSLELSKTISCGWGGILINNNEYLEQAIDEDYKNTPEENLTTSCRKLLQVFLTGLLYSEYVYFIGKYIVALGYRIDFFKGSTTKQEFEGLIPPTFIRRLNGPQSSLAESQFRRLKNISITNNRNFLDIQKSLEGAGLSVLQATSENQFSVSPRVVFFVSDPKRASDWFFTKGIELGTWFSGSLSPLPIFNFDINFFPNAQFVSNHIVNLPCHNRLTKCDLAWLKNVIESFAKENPDQLNVDIKDIS